MEQKIENFLPSKCVDELKEELDSRIRMFNGESTTPQMKKVAEGVGVAKIILNGWLESYTTEELEGIKPKVSKWNLKTPSFLCGECSNIIANSYKYCDECGKKIDWEGW